MRCSVMCLIKMVRKCQTYKTNRPQGVLITALISETFADDNIWLMEAGRILLKSIPAILK